MKLLKPTDLTKEKDKQLAINAKRSVELDSELMRKRHEIEKANLEFEVNLEKSRAEWEKEKEEYITSVNSLKREVELLEDRKKDALVPIDDRWKEVEQADRIVKGKEAEVESKIEALNDSVELLQSKLTNVAERELKCQEREVKQINSQLGIDQQKEQVSNSSKLINEQIIKATEDFKLKEKEFNLREAILETREKLVISKDIELNKIEKGFIERERQIKDRYATLERAEKEYASKER